MTQTEPSEHQPGQTMTSEGTITTQTHKRGHYHDKMKTNRKDKWKLTGKVNDTKEVLKKDRQEGMPTDGRDLSESPQRLLLTHKTN